MTTVLLCPPQRPRDPDPASVSVSIHTDINIIGSTSVHTRSQAPALFSCYLVSVGLAPGSIAMLSFRYRCRIHCLSRCTYPSVSRSRQCLTSSSPRITVVLLVKYYTPRPLLNVSIAFCCAGIIRIRVLVVFRCMCRVWAYVSRIASYRVRGSLSQLEFRTPALVAVFFRPT